MKVLQVLHLPSKISLRCSKCCTCHAKWHWGAASVALMVLWWCVVDGVVSCVDAVVFDGVFLKVLCWSSKELIKSITASSWQVLSCCKLSYVFWRLVRIKSHSIHLTGISWHIHVLYERGTNRLVAFTAGTCTLLEDFKKYKYVKKEIRMGQGYH